MDPREASMVVAGRRDLSQVTLTTWVGELRRMAARLQPAERVYFVDLVLHSENGGQKHNDLLACTGGRVLIGHAQDGLAISMDDVTWVEGSGKETTLTLRSGGRMEIESPWGEEKADRLRAVLWGRRPQPPSAGEEMARDPGLQPWEPSSDQRRSAFLRAVLRPVMLLAVVASAAFVALGLGLLLDSVLGFDWWGAVAVPVWIAISALLALIGARVTMRDQLFDAMHRDALATLDQEGQPAGPPV